MISAQSDGAAAASTRRAGRPQLNCPCRGEQQAALKSQNTEWKTPASGHDFQNKIQRERASLPPIFTHPEERFWPLHPNLFKKHEREFNSYSYICSGFSCTEAYLFLIFVWIEQHFHAITFKGAQHSFGEEIFVDSLKKKIIIIITSKQTKQTLWLCLWYMMNFGLTSF